MCRSPGSGRASRGSSAIRRRTVVVGSMGSVIYYAHSRRCRACVRSGRYERAMIAAPQWSSRCESDADGARPVLLTAIRRSKQRREHPSQDRVGLNRAYRERGRNSDRRCRVAGARTADSDVAEDTDSAPLSQSFLSALLHVRSLLRDGVGRFRRRRASGRRISLGLPQ